MTTTQLLLKIVKIRFTSPQYLKTTRKNKKNERSLILVCLFLHILHPNSSQRQISTDQLILKEFHRRRLSQKNFT